MTAIAATTGTIRSRVDGTLVMTIEFEPSQAQDAFKLFAAPGTQVAIAALKDGSFLAQPVAEPKPREQLGDACYRTVLWCADPHFWNFLNNTPFFGDASFRIANSPLTASKAVKTICNVESRKELDTDPEANKKWHREIRQPYADYLKRMEAA